MREIFDISLCHNVEISHSVYLIVKKLDSNGIFTVRRKNINDTASHRILSHTVNEIAPDKSACFKARNKCVKHKRYVNVYCNRILAQDINRHRELHCGIGRGNYTIV